MVLLTFNSGLFIHRALIVIGGPVLSLLLAPDARVRAAGTASACISSLVLSNGCGGRIHTDIQHVSV